MSDVAPSTSSQRLTLRPSSSSPVSYQRDGVLARPAGTSPTPLPSLPPGLAPLELLQSHRRGSITDPSLHASGSSNVPTFPMKTTSSRLHERGERPPPLWEGERGEMIEGPTSKFRFGDATPAPKAVNENSQLRKLLRSPTEDERRSPVGGDRDDDPGKLLHIKSLSCSYMRAI